MSEHSRRKAAAILLGLALAFGLFEPLFAQSLVVDAGHAGESGLQADAAFVSPRAARPLAGEMDWETYTVKAGDTLASIAARFGVAAAQLAALNGLANLDRVDAGRVLKVKERPLALPSLAADGPLSRLQLWPWPPVQGQTLVGWLRTSAQVSLSLGFAGQAYPLVTEGDRAWVLVPIPALAEPATMPMTITAGTAVLRLMIPVRAGDFERDDVPASASDPILSQTEKVQAELSLMTALFSREDLTGWTPVSRFRLPFEGIWPRTSPFGSRRAYGSSSAVTAHTGEDWSAPPGTPVLAPAEGVVVLAEPLFVRGNAVVIDHGQGVYTGYWHLQKIIVQAGSRVARGQLLGEVGNTGLSTGAHLHWELRIHGTAVDPLQWVGQ